MKAKKIEDVVVYREAVEAENAIIEILERPVFRKDLNLKGQLDRSAARIGPLICEGFGQLTDRHLASYLGRARGSALETKGHLRRARRRRFISEAEYANLTARYNTIGKRLTRWIQYLDGTDWSNRG